MIPPHMLRELRYLEISTARVVRNVRIGPHTSRSRGSGFDFDQHLAYRPGDDVRRIDWNATARLNSPYVRLTHAERELDVVMALDLSPSMAIGSSRYSKKEVTTFVAASFLFSAAADQINAGFLTFSDRVLGWTPPRRATARAWRVLEEIWSLEPGDGRTRLLPAIRHLLAVLVIALNERTRGSYAAAVASRRRSIKDACHRLGIDVVFVRTDAAAMEPLIELFARRRGA